MKKSTIAIILCILSVFGIFSPLAGCSSEATVTKAEVLYRILDSFGMLDDSLGISEEEIIPDAATLSECIEIAQSWGMLDSSSLASTEPATKGFLAELLVKCVDFLDTSAMTSDEILEYAANNNYVSFQYRGRTDSKRTVTREEVLGSISKSFDIWTNRELPQVEEVNFGENVQVLQKEDLDPQQIVIEEQTNTVTLPAEYADSIKPGETFVVPQKDEHSTMMAFQADQVEVKDGKLVVSTSPAELETTIENLKVSGSVTPDLANSYIVDGAGNVVGNPGLSSPVGSLDERITLSRSGTPGIGKINQNKLAQSGSLEFTMDGLKIKGTVKSNSVSFKLSGEIWANKAKGLKLTVDKEFEVKDIHLDYDYNIEWFKLKSAYAKVGYTTVDKTGVGFSWKKEGVFAPPYSNGNGHFLSNASRAILKDSQAKGAKTIKICSIPIVSSGVVSFNLDVKIKLSMSGSVELSVTTSNTKGIEYKNGKVRYIKDQHQDTDLTAKGKAELTLYAGFSFRAVSINIVGFGIEGGIGCAVSLTAHLADTDNHLMDEVSFGDVNATIFEDTLPDLNGVSYTHETRGAVTLKCELCTDIVTYLILKLALDSDSVIGKAVKGKAEIVFYDKDNAKIDFLCAHWEDGVKVPACTRKYNGDEEETTEATDSADNPDQTNSSDQSNQQQNGDLIDIDVYFVNIGIGESYQIKVEELPEGYSLSDIVFISSDSSVASVNGNGVITGLAEGSAEIKAQTKDHKYEVSCNVFVVGSNASSSGKSL